MNVCTTFDYNLCVSCWDITLKITNINLTVVLWKTSGKLLAIILWEPWMYVHCFVPIDQADVGGFSKYETMYFVTSGGANYQLRNHQSQLGSPSGHHGHLCQIMTKYAVWAMLQSCCRYYLSQIWHSNQWYYGHIAPMDKIVNSGVLTWTSNNICCRLWHTDRMSCAKMLK